MLGPGPLQLSISALELIAATALVKVFASRASSSEMELCLELSSDSAVATYAQHRWYSPVSTLNDILKELALVVLRYDAALMISHVPGVENVWADSLSRGDVSKFDPKKRIRTNPFNIEWWTCVPTM